MSTFILHQCFERKSAAPVSCRCSRFYSVQSLEAGNTLCVVWCSFSCSRNLSPSELQVCWSTSWTGKLRGGGGADGQMESWITSTGCWWLQYGRLLVLKQPEYDWARGEERKEVAGNTSNAPWWAACCAGYLHLPSPRPVPPQVFPGGHFGPEK